MCEIRVTRIWMAICFAIALGAIPATAAVTHSAEAHSTTVASASTSPSGPGDTYWDDTVKLS